MSFEPINIYEMYDREYAITERRQLITGYLEEIDTTERTISENIAEQICDESTTLADTVVVVPVAAHQESANIANAVSQYAKQRCDKPFTVVFGLNCPTNAKDTEEVTATIHEVESAKVEYPDLDLRFSFVDYEDPVIGEVRRDLWNGVAILAGVSGLVDKVADITIVNHDIDVVWMSDRVIQNVQTQYEKDNSGKFIVPISSVYATKLKHSYNHLYPNISGAVLWSDFVSRYLNLPFEAGMVVPLSFYAKNGGINKDKRVNEIHSMVRGAGSSTEVLMGTSTVTSIRRYLDRMPSDGYDVWHEDTFGPDDACRKRPEFSDISLERQVEIIRTQLTYNVIYLSFEAVRKSIIQLRIENSRRRKENISPISTDADSQEFYQWIYNAIHRLGLLASAVMRRSTREQSLIEYTGDCFSDEAKKRFTKEYLEDWN